MIRFVNNENIDRNLWDKTIMQSSMPMIYAMSWYLDIVAPEWHGFIQDDYKTVMPIVSSRKFGLTYLYQPPFCQQHGVFGNNVSADLVKEFMQKGIIKEITGYQRNRMFVFNEYMDLFNK